MRLDEIDKMERKIEQQRNKKRKKKKSTFKSLFSIILILLLCTGVYKLVDKYMPNFKEISIRKIFPQWDNDHTVIVLKDTAIKADKPAVNQKGEIYLPVQFIKDYIDKYIFWEESSSKLTITTENKVIRMKTDDLTAYVNDEPFKLALPIEIINGTAYMPKTLLESLYDISVTYNETTDIAIVDYTDQVKKTGKIISKKAIIRSESNIKAYIVQKLVLGDECVVYDSKDGWTKVRTKEGILGYTETENIGNIVELKAKEKEVITKGEVWKPKNGKINMAWDQVFKVTNNTDSNRIKTQKGLDILSPTWFSISDGTGLIKNIADKRYVEWAHSQGYQVWALLSNSFDAKITHDALSKTDTRAYVIKQILALASLYDLDGINIDFESVAKEDGDYYLQFIRELTPYLKKQGVIVSVDVYVPAAWTQHYQRDEVAKIVDYIMIMAYDEHWSTSPESGSVASIGWVKRGIQNSLAQIPSEKLIMGIPYYTRLWAETPADGGVKVSSQAYGMDNARKLLKDHNVEPVWDQEAGQYYGQYVENGVTYKIWLEDEASIKEKVKLVKEYNLAGIAGWKRGMENNGTWDTLYENLK
jgi:spore germination protein YaaH